ncbi:MAG: hypothetical protein WED00_09945, partial [Aquisalimonadaceae bacterium]
MVLWLCSVSGGKARLAGNGEPLPRGATPPPGTLQSPAGRAIRARWTALAFLPRATAIACERRLASALG